MYKYVPDMYVKSILDINYNMLKKKGIKYIIFDFDNTIALLDECEISPEFSEKIKILSKEFKVLVISNNFSKRIKLLCSKLEIKFISLAMKPLSISFKRILNKLGCQKNEMCMIGDQLITDILGANRFGIYSILVDPLGKDNIKFTGINRLIEKNIISKLSKLGILERGKYYE